MTDITKLARSLKAAAEKASPGNWRAFQYHDGRCGVGGGNHDEIMVCEHISKKRPHDALFIALANPANILALVEALEKGQRANAAQGDHIEQQQDRIESLEKKNAELGKYAGGLESFRTAYMEWSDKTDWVQKDKRFDVLKPWGKHRADVLKEYIQHLESRTVMLERQLVGRVDEKSLTTINPAPTLDLLPKNAESLTGNSPVNDVTAGKSFTILLPDISSKAFWSGAGKNETFHPETYRRWVKEAIERYCAIARIDVEVK